MLRSRRKHIPVFGQLEYENGNGMITTVWGPAWWHCLHTMSFNYPVAPSPRDKKYYRDFIRSLVHVLPCGKCRANLKKNLATFPLLAKHMESRETFSRYIFELHEMVNRMLGKPSGLTYEEVRDTYEHFRARCGGTGEKGCTEPIYHGKKPQCIVQILPRSCSIARSRRHLRISKDCFKRVVR